MWAQCNLPQLWQIRFMEKIEQLGKWQWRLRNTFEIKTQHLILSFWKRVYRCMHTDHTSWLMPTLQGAVSSCMAHLQKGPIQSPWTWQDYCSGIVLETPGWPDWSVYKHGTTFPLSHAQLSPQHQLSEKLAFCSRSYKYLCDLMPIMKNASARAITNPTSRPRRSTAAKVPSQITFEQETEWTLAVKSYKNDLQLRPSIWKLKEKNNLSNTSRPPQSWMSSQRSQEKGTGLQNA